MISIPVVYSLVLATPVLGLYNTRNTKHHLKRYFKFARANIVLPAVSVAVFYVSEVMLRLIFSNYIRIPLIMLLLALLAPILTANKKMVDRTNLSEKEVKFMAGLMMASILFWIIRLF